MALGVFIVGFEILSWYTRIGNLYASSVLTLYTSIDIYVTFHFSSQLQNSIEI